MDTYDMNDQPAGVEPQEQPKCEPQTRSNSPFANSPYVMNREQPVEDPYRYQDTYVPPVPPREPPRKVKKEKKNGGKVWKAVLASVLTVALVACGCGVTAMIVNDRWEAQTEQMTQDFIHHRMSRIQDVLLERLWCLF